MSAVYGIIAGLVTLAITLYLRHLMLKPFRSAVAVRFSIADARRCLLPRDEQPAKLRYCTTTDCACWDPDKLECTADACGGPVVEIQADP